LQDLAGTECFANVARPESETAPASAPVTAHPAAAEPTGASVSATDDVQEFVGELEFHPTADLLPPMTDAEFASLVASIAAHGQREPFVLHRNRIVDGRNRYRACRQLGIAVKVKPWDERGSLVAFVMDRNLERRHLSESQRALLAARLKGAFEEEARANMSRGGQGLANLPTLHSRDQAAATVKVSSRLVGSAAKVVKQGAPALVAAVGRDEVTASAAADVVALDPGEQAALVAQGPAAVRQKARELRAARTRSKEPRSADSTERPEDPAPAGTVDVGDASLLPPPGWLEQFAVRSRLTDTARFDFLASLWWVAQQLLDRFDLRLGEDERRAGALVSSFDPDLTDLHHDGKPGDLARLCLLRGSRT
jgi:ParB-like chromosome segregation protein Spo0J